MTPEQIEEIYYTASAKAFHAHEVGVKPLDQKAVRMAGWQAVIDAMNQENDIKLANQYLHQNT
jgi:hypothetical protein